MWHFVSEKISETINYDFICDDIRAVEGGDTHQAFKISDGKKRFFVKTNSAEFIHNFQCESTGLERLRNTDIVRIPRPICHGIAEQQSFLVLEHITLKEADEKSWFDLGCALAKLHQQTHQRYGADANNYLGPTQQPNGWSDDWAAFFAEHRIGYMLQKLAEHAIRFVDIDQAISSVKTHLKDHQPKPSLLHGDLWVGNVGFHNHQPVIFDPAYYFGDRETDLAMSELFAGFPPAFYDGYQQTWPLDSGYQQRKIIYQLYHILNHALLFGGHYTKSAKSTFEQLVH